MPEKLVQMVARQGCGRPDIIERQGRNTCQTVAMAAVRGVVTRWLDDAFPGWVEFALTDVEGMVHIFHEKAPVPTLELLLASDPLPTRTVGCLRGAQPGSHRSTSPPVGRH